MPYTELLNWFEFFERRPIGWREDYRTYLTLKAAGAKVSPEQTFNSLKIISEKRQEKLQNDRAVPRGRILELMLKAKGGDGSKWKPNFNGNKND